MKDMDDMIESYKPLGDRDKNDPKHFGVKVPGSCGADETSRSLDAVLPGMINSKGDDAKETEVSDEKSFDRLLNSSKRALSQMDSDGCACI